MLRDRCHHRAFTIPSFCQVRALLTEELLEETRRLKEESLRQFQEAVRRRVSEQARIHKQRQLQKSYKTVSQETDTKKNVKLFMN